MADYTRLQKLQREQEETRQLLRDHRGDAAMEELAGDELDQLGAAITELRQRLTLALLPRDPRDERSVMLEIRAGAGGDEAAIWAGDLARMYERYAQSQGWQVQPVSASEAELGGYKELILAIRAKACTAGSSSRRACTGCSGCRPPNPRAGCTPPPPRWR